MSAPEEKKPTGNGVLLLAIVAVVALGGGVYWLHLRSDMAKKDLDRSVEEFNQLRDMKARVQEMQRRAGGAKKVQAPTDNPQDLVNFFGQKRRDHGIPNIAIKQPDREVPWTGWKEYPYTLTIRKEDAVPLLNFVNFLAAIERERPYLKSKAVTINYEEGKMVWGSVTISFFKESK